MFYNLKQKYGNWALITGASAGIGEAFARSLAKEKINLILIARREENLKLLSDELKRSFQIETILLPLDLTSTNYLKNLDESIKGIEIGLLINNAGAGRLNKFSEIETSVMSDIVKLNCVAPVEITTIILPGMINRKRGGIIFVSSIVGYQPVPYYGVYSATKVFDLFLGESLWYELKEHNIDVLTVSPGGTNTEFQQVAGSTQKEYYRSSEQVVSTALKNIGKKSSVVDGWFNKLLICTNRLLPRKWSIILAAKIVKNREKIN